MNISGVNIVNEHISIVKVLLNKLEEKGNELICYKDLSNIIGGYPHYRNLDSYLGDLSSVCKENDLPLISAIVINKETGVAGDGFIKYFFEHLKTKEEREAQYIKSLNEVLELDNWDKLKRLLKII